MSRVRRISRRRFGGTGFGKFASGALSAFVFAYLLSSFSSELRAANEPAATAQKPAFEAGQVTARVEQGYARLVLSFANRPKHTVNSSAMNTGVLVLRFERPVDVNLNGLADKLPTYISNMRRDPDGLSLRFALARKIRVNTTEAGNDLYIDMLPEPWFGAPPALPPEVVAELAREAEEKARLAREQKEREARAVSLGPVQVQSSEAPTFTRIEFIWREKVATSLQRNNDQLRLVFERPGELNLTQMKIHLPRFVEDIGTSQEDLRTIVTMKVDPMRDVRMFQEGNAVYVDIQGPQRGSLEFRSDGQIGKSDVPDLALGDNGPKVKIVGGAPDTQTSPPPQVQAEAEQPKPQETFPMSAPATEPVKESALTPQMKAAEPAPQAPIPVIKPKKSAAAANTVTPEVLPIETTGTRMTFMFNTETPAAIFQRGPVLWMVFGSDEKIDTSPIKTVMERKLKSIDVTYQNKVSIVRAVLNAPALVSATSLDTSWTVTLSDSVLSMPEPAELKARAAPDGRGVVNGYMSRAASIEKIRDPVVGDNMMVVLALGSPIAMIKPQQFVDFTSLATAQGAAMPIISDDLTFRLDDIGFVIERSGSMPVSFATSQRTTQLSSAQQMVSFGFIDFEGWKLGPIDEHNMIKNDLINRAAASEGPARNAARLDLARFYLAYENGEEAQAMLNLVAKDDPSAERELGFRVVRGVANIFARRGAEALRDLSDPLLDENADVAIWRGLAYAQVRDWRQAQRNLEKTQTAVVNYPRTLQADVLLNLARATIETHDLVNTDAVLDEAANTVSTPAARDELALLRGLFNEAVGRYDAAIGFYKQVDQTRMSRSATEAMMRMVSLQEKLGQVEDKDAIAALEGLSFSWRGDDLELQMYHRLGTFYVKNDLFRQAFSMMRNAMLTDPEAEISRQLYDDMRVVFTSLYLDGKADKMPAIDALSLFYDYKELTPAGRLGDEITRNLASRLVEVDLLDQAVDLLAYQVKNRLTGNTRAEVGTELALIHLMNRQPEKALSALHRTRQTTMPEDMEKRRTFIEARALAATGRPELAIELISSNTPENMRLRADILWEGKSWQLCGETVEKLLGNTGQGSAALTEQERNDILRGAVAFALAGDNDGVRRFRMKFLKAMSDTQEARLFDVATGPIESQGSEFRTLAKSLAGADTMQSLSKMYREIYGRGATQAPQVKAAPPTEAAPKNPS